jgi:hypothetical protein
VFAKFQKAAISFFLSVCPSAWSRWDEIWCLSRPIFRKPVDKIQASLISEKNNEFFPEDMCTFMIVTRLIILRMRNISDECCRENLHFFPPENHAVMEEPDRPQMAV